MNRKNAAKTSATSLASALPSPMSTACARAVTCAEEPSGGHGDHERPGGQQVGEHHRERAPDEVPRDRPWVLDLDAHVERHLDAEQREDHQAEEAPVGQVESGVRRRRVRRPVPGVGDGRARTEDVRESGDEHQQDGQAVQHEDDVHEVLGEPEPLVGEERRQHDEHDDDQALDLHARRADRGREHVAQEAEHDGAGGDHDEDAGPPGAEAREEAPEGAERLLRPEVDRALTGEHPAELAGHDRAGDQEEQEAQHPPAEGRRAGALDHRGVGDEQDDRDEDRHHVERVEDLRQHAPCHSFRRELAVRLRAQTSHRTLLSSVSRLEPRA